MTLERQALMIANMLLVICLSGIIGLDRERKAERKQSGAAGLRTHILVGMGACLFTILSVYAFPDGDTSRVAAQVVSGIGFLGAGVIFVKRDSVRNLTTAASIWATAAVGMAVGAGAWLLAIAVTLMIWWVLVIMRRFESK